MAARINLTGKKFNRLSVLRELGSNKILCLCDCGKETKVWNYNLISGHTKSCGCLRGDLWRKHDKSRTPEYQAWQGLKDRCLNLKSLSYKNYGGRGIKVCDRWLDSFENFYADMGERPDGLTLERIDNNGNYDPGNCKWATRLEQQNNTRNNKILTFKGKSQTVPQWSRETGISAKCIHHRLGKNWPIESILTKPKRNCSLRFESYRGIIRTVADWCKRTGISTTTLTRNLNKGKTLKTIFLEKGVI